MMIFKKIGFIFVYYFLASLIDNILMMFFGNAYISFILTALCICVISCAFKCAQIRNRNYLQEQRDAYNASFKSRFEHIVSSLDFKVEIVIGVVVSLVFMLIPRVAYGACYAFVLLYSNRFYMLALIPLYIIADFTVWYIAYQKCFRKKKF